MEDIKEIRFIPPNRASDALLGDGEKRAFEFYKNKLQLIQQATGRKMGPARRYDFNRGFEYGVAWALANHHWLKDCQ